MGDRHTIRTVFALTSLAAVAAVVARWLKEQNAETPFTANAPVPPRYAPRGDGHPLQTSEEIASEWMTESGQGGVATTSGAGTISETASEDSSQRINGTNLHDSHAGETEHDRLGPADDLVDRRDDLTLIKGIGPVIERTLNAMGITRYSQIANFSEADITRVEEALGSFSGRVVRDEWVQSARELAADA